MRAKDGLGKEGGGAPERGLYVVSFGLEEKAPRRGLYATSFGFEKEVSERALYATSFGFEGGPERGLYAASFGFEKDAPERALYTSFGFDTGAPVRGLCAALSWSGRAPQPDRVLLPFDGGARFRWKDEFCAKARGRAGRAAPLSLSLSLSPSLPFSRAPA